MLIDLIILLILAFFITLGYRNGFLHTFTRLIGWGLAFIAVYFLHNIFYNFLKNNTGLYDVIHSKAFSYAADSINISGFLEDYIDSLIDFAIKGTVDSIFAIVSLVILLICVKLIFSIITLIFSAKKNKGLLGSINRFFGILAGLSNGLIVVFIAIALLVPVAMGVNGPDGQEWVMESLDNSFIAWIFYDYNPILLFIDGYLPNMYDINFELPL